MSDAFVDAVRNNLDRDSLSTQIIEATANGNDTISVSVDIPVAEAAALLVTKPTAKKKKRGGAGRPPAIITAVKEAKGITTEEAKIFVRNNSEAAEKILQEKKDKRNAEKNKVGSMLSRVSSEAPVVTEPSAPDKAAETDDEKAMDALANA
tara:strand:- start:9874 stop:10326 length:453 start_codon:yes stop_codon:yes gene_type:complete